MTANDKKPGDCIPLSERGESCARLLKQRRRVRAVSYARRLRAELATVRRAHDVARRAASAGEESPANRWLLDNWYLVRREGLSAASDLAHGGRLRTCGDGAILLCACEALVRCVNCTLTLEDAAAFFSGFQRVTPLERHELTLLAPCLRAALTGCLAALCGGGGDEALYAAIFTSLRLLSSEDLTPFLESLDTTEAILLGESAGVYALMDERTRESYRRRVSELASLTQMSELRVARAAVKLADDNGRHVGYYLFTRPLGMRRHGAGGWAYIALNLLITLTLSLLSGFAFNSAAAAALLVLPLSELVKGVADHFALRFSSPRLVPRMELADGVPEEGRTLCVISALLTSPDAGVKMARRAEEFLHASRECGKNLSFGLLCDLPESATETTPNDAPCVSAVRSAVDELNDRYGGGFYLLLRPRSYAADDGVWRGDERKRGALLDLSRLLAGKESGVSVLSGDGDALRGCRYIITLDADTVLPPGAARELIGAMLHPLNTPVIDEKRGVVISGHGLIHPRIGTELSSAVKSRFAGIFAPGGGLDPYGSSCGEVYMDLSGHGGFAGKGIIDAAALLRCTAELPKGRILSHDAVEGALLRGGYMSDCELLDGMPATPLAWWRRMERWIRGDWQNLPFAFDARLADIDRWRFFDNAQRSLLAPASLAAIVAGFFSGEAGLVLAALTALLTLCRGLVGALTASLSDHRRHTLGSALTLAAARLMLLPCEAWVALSAVLRALRRMYVTKRGLLEWSTAAQTERGASGPATYLAALWPAGAVGLACVFSHSVIGAAAGMIWLLSPLAAHALGASEPAAREPGARERGFLLDASARMWAFFDVFCTAENHFLPPDNYQEQPPTGEALRTSPTNIGLALTSCLAALDLGLAEKGRCAEIVGGILTTLEKLPKWHGHIYNWLDIRTLRALSPVYISTVDSGNLAVCLTALAEGMDEYGLPALARRARALCSDMDFKPLYDGRRRLFHIGFELGADSLSEGCYDLLASEARLTSYFAVARGDVPRAHWRRLSRALVGVGARQALSSWTGSMFEYLMPELFLTPVRGSLLWQSTRLCVSAHISEARGGIWGASESAFFALDPALAYRYKAHGCPALALSRDVEGESVRAPYASFLALAVAPASAVANLRRFADVGAFGRFGFCEALDLTPSRCRSEDGELVKCVMAHHIGMSLAAVDNYLCLGAMRRRFMASPAASAFRPLLCEEAPTGGVVLQGKRSAAPSRPPRSSVTLWERTGACVCFEKPECCLLSNGVYSLALTESGLSRACAGAVGIYRLPETYPGDRHGLELRAQPENGAPYSLLPTPGAAGFRWRFTGSEASIEGRSDDLEWRCAASVSAADCAELRSVTLKAAAAFSGRITLEFEPMLARVNDYVNHPAFYRLGLSAECVGGMLLLRRRARFSLGECCLAVGCDADAEYSANAYGEALGALSYPLVRVGAPVRLAAGESVTIRFSMAFAAEPRSAAAAARRALALSGGERADIAESLSAPLALGISGATEAMAMASALLFPRACGEVKESRNALWRFGVSGDEPIICAYHGEDTAATAALISRHALLRAAGLKSDLVFLSGEGGDYLRASTRALRAALAAMGLESTEGARGGVHVVPEAEASAFLDRAALIAGSPRPERRPDGAYLPPQGSIRGGTPRCEWSDDAVSFTVEGSLPARAWTHILTDGAFGCIAAEYGTVCMWYENAREKRITPWRNDPLDTAGVETLEMLSGGRRVSLFAASDGIPCRVTYSFGFARWEKVIDGAAVSVTAHVPPGGAGRVLTVRGARSAVFWKAELVLAADADDARFTVTEYSDGRLRAHNACAPGLELSAVFSAEPIGFTCDAASWQRGVMDSRCGAGLLPCFGVELPPCDTLVIPCSCGDAAALLSRFDEAESRTAWERVLGRLRVRTPSPELDRYINDWAGYQTLACRLLGRASLYQSGGAFGFRDQLQDAVNLILLDPSLARKQILLCCAHQYEQGDVMHWWHPGERETGVRTRCSDDLLWLPWAVCEYVESTGDTAILGEETPFLTSPPLADNERDRYERAEISLEKDTVAAHAARALALVLARGSGAHGLPLIGGGDWNDGMDAVGSGGRGESVWLGWFFAHSARRFAGLLEKSGKKRDAAALLSAAIRFGRAADRAWDGAWYLRGFYDDGAPLGSRDCKECAIDSVAQSWSCLCAEASPKKSRAALTSAISHLHGDGLTRLFSPPFDGAERPGYIASCGPGFRENGGQYTHAAVWLALACLRSGRADEGWELLRSLLPVDSEEYGAEPYVLAADVYAAPERLGEAGWTWYTGAAGWYLRTAISELLGIRLENGRLTVNPALPSGWDGYSAVWTDGAGTKHSIEVRDGRTYLDGLEINK